MADCARGLPGHQGGSPGVACEERSPSAKASRPNSTPSSLLPHLGLHWGPPQAWQGEGGRLALWRPREGGAPVTGVGRGDREARNQPAAPTGPLQAGLQGVASRPLLQRRPGVQAAAGGEGRPRSPRPVWLLQEGLSQSQASSFSAASARSPPLALTWCCWVPAGRRPSAPPSRPGCPGQRSGGCAVQSG